MDRSVSLGQKALGTLATIQVVGNKMDGGGCALAFGVWLIVRLRRTDLPHVPEYPDFSIRWEVHPLVIPTRVEYSAPSLIWPAVQKIQAYL